jgi:hypothetical protein
MGSFEPISRGAARRREGRAGTVAARPPTADGGLGMHLVAALAHRLGVTRAGLTRVWIERDCRPSRDQQTASPST